MKAEAETEGLQSLYEQLQKIDPQAASRISANDAKRIIRALEVYRLTGKPISTFQTQWTVSRAVSRASSPRPSLFNDWTLIGLRRDKTEESKRINARVKKMLDAGLVDEVKGLLAEEKPLSDQARLAIGYAEIIDYLSAKGETSPAGGAGKTPLENAIELIKKNSRKLAKAQRTWFKTFKNTHWLELTSDETIDEMLSKTLALLQNEAKSG